MGKDWDRLSTDAVSQSWDTRGRSMTGAPVRDPSSPGGRSGASIHRKDNPRCDTCGRAVNGRATAKGFKVCECETPAPRLPSVSARKMQAWHEAWAREAFRVLKPGGHLIAFGGTRTYHRLVCAVEDAGFEIRDTLAWMYGQGFPKSLDVSKAIDKAAHVCPVHGPPPPGLQACDRCERSLVPAERDEGVPYIHPRDGVPYVGPEQPAGQGTSFASGVRAPMVTAPATPEAQQWQGWGTALKPAHEPIVLARKPLSGTVAATVLEHGTGALNIDGCRIGSESTQRASTTGDFGLINDDGWAPTPGVIHGSESGRWPSNVIFDPEAARMLDEQTGELGKSSGTYGGAGGRVYANGGGLPVMDDRVGDQVGFGDTGGASRFFYCAKTSSAERNAGLDGFEPMGRTIGSKRCAACGRQKVNMPGSECKCPEPREWVAVEDHSPQRNVHPTVKPIDLMRWLVRLVTPPGGTVLDPFTGSGTTGCAAVLEGFDFVGIERDDEYIQLARARVAWWAEHPDGMELTERLEHEAAAKALVDAGQLDIFGGEA